MTKIQLGLICLCLMIEISACTDLAPPKKLMTAEDSTTLFVGSYTKVFINIPADADYTFDDLDFRVPAGEEGGNISRSRMNDDDPTQPYITLLSGYRTGDYALEAVNRNSNEVLASLPFSVTTEWDRSLQELKRFYTGDTGPMSVSGAAWGGGTSDAPQNYRTDPVEGEYRVAVVFVDTEELRWNDADFNAAEAQWQNVLNNEVAPYFEEVSYGNLQMDFTFVGPVSLSGSWAGYFQHFHGRNSDGEINDFDNGGQANIIFYQAVVTAADELLDYNDFHSIICVSRSLTNENPVRYAWPFARRANFQSEEENEYGSHYINLGMVSMPFDWTVQQPSRRIAPTVAHELGHNFGLGDIYSWSGHSQAIQDRQLGGWAVMANENGFPKFVLPHKLQLGWVDADQIKRFDFAQNDGQAVNTAVVLSNNDNNYRGIEVRKAEGWNYYFELRQAEAGAISDQALPRNSRILGTDVAFGDVFRQVQRRKPVMLLPPLEDGAVLDAGEVYIERDLTEREEGNQFSFTVNSINPDRASVTVRYGSGANVIHPDPAVPIQPDPAISPASRASWQSPDIWVENARTDANPIFWNMPMVNEINRVSAAISNNTAIDATNVRVQFFAKDYNVSSAPPVLLQSFDTVVRAFDTTTLQTEWRPLTAGHYCIEVEILPYVLPPDIPEITVENNRAQSNFTRFVSASASPAERIPVELTITNPYDQRTEATLHLEQSNPLYRTYIESTALNLEPNESQKVECWFEYAYGDRELPAGASQLVDVSNKVNLYASFSPPDDGADADVIIGGALVEVISGRAVQFSKVRSTASQVSGTVQSVDDQAPVPGGTVIAAFDAGQPSERQYQLGEVNGLGKFQIELRAGWENLTTYYVPTTGYGEAQLKVTP